MKRTQNGFSLMEALVAVIILTVIAATFASMMLMQNKQEAKTDFREIETRELSQLYYATKAYMKETPSAVTATTAQIGLNTLIAAGKLPQAFATRGGTLGQTPWRQTYTIYAKLDATDNKPRAVIHEGSPAASAPNLLRAGVPNTTVAIAALKSDIATKVTSAYKIPAATIAAGTLSAVGALNAFTKNITGVLPTAPMQTAAAVLVGYPDLEPPDTVVTSGSKWGNCTFSPPTKSTAFANYGQPIAAVCPAGTQNLVHVSTSNGVKQGFPFCRMNHHFGETNYTIYPTDIGDLTIGAEQQTDPIVILMGFYNYGCHTDPITGTVSGCTSSAQRQPYTNTFKNEVVMLNGAEVYATPTCLSDVFYQASEINPPTNTNGCSSSGPNIGEPNPPDGVGCAIEGSARDGYVDGFYNGATTVPGLGQDARVLLCCQQLTP
ncbi:MAG: prepilin-type N-terminal cleavage/methylation domain-containing protein [Dokdonella sp.]